MRRSKKAFATRSRRPMKAYATEGIIRKMYAAMCEDLSSNLSPLRDLAVARKRDPRCEIENMVPGSVPAWIYKRFVQLSSFHKRWLLESDKVPDKESLKDFIHSQSVFSLPPLCKRSAAVLAVAKDLVANILGPFDLDVFARHCAYGKKAALGLSARKSYLDNRVKRPSGTLEQVALYNEVRSRDLTFCVQRGAMSTEH